MKTKEQKRTEAEERKKNYDTLSRQEKLNKLNTGKWVAKKEREKNGFPPLT